MSSYAVRLLLRRLAVMFVLAVIAVVLGGLAQISFQVPLLLLLALGVGVGWWLVDVLDTSGESLTWAELTHPVNSLHVGSDGRTRRLESLLAAADRTHHMGTRTLAGTLRDLTAHALVRSGADPRDPFAGAHLSSGLAAYLDSARADPPTLSRRTLHAYLKEISRL